MSSSVPYLPSLPEDIIFAMPLLTLLYLSSLPQESADSPASLKVAGEVFAPIVSNRQCCAIRVGEALFYEIPVIVKITFFDADGGTKHNPMHTSKLRRLKIAIEASPNLLIIDKLTILVP